MTETFKFSVSSQTEGTINQKVQTSDFGDGYSQSTSIGINNQSEEWNVNFKGKASYINQIRDFLDRHEGSKSFYWTPPDGKQGRYRSTNYKINPLGGNVYELTSTFAQTFEPASVAASEYVRYINAITPDKDGNVTLTALDVSADDRGAASKAITDLKAETNPLPQYALKTDVPDLTEINTRLDTAEGNITTAQSNISGLKSDVTTILANLSDQQTQVEGINTEVTSIKSDLSNQSTQIGSLQTTVSTNTTDIVELKNGRVKTVNGLVADETGNIQLEIDAGSEINDSVTAINSTWSSQNINNVLTDNTRVNNGAGKISYNSDLNYLEGTVGYAIKNSGEPLFSVKWWSSRDHIPAGYIAADGQELPILTYLDAANAIANGVVPTTTNEDWLNNPIKRGCYVAESSAGNFRLPDYNGRYTNSLGALFLRGDDGQVKNGEIQTDGVGDINIPIKTSNQKTAHYIGWFDSKTHLMPAPDFAGSGWNSWSDAPSKAALTNRINNINLGSTDTRPLNISGCWIIKLFGVITNTGSADAAQLATDYANMASRLTVLEGNLNNKSFTIIYPNGGTESNPANVDTNKRYELTNPFPGYHVICIAELFIDGNWGETGWIYANNANYGTKVSMFNLDKIVIVTGNGRIVAGSPDGGQPFPKGTTAPTSAPCRVKVWRQI